MSNMYCEDFDAQIARAPFQYIFCLIKEWGFPYKDRTVVIAPYLYNGNPYTGNMMSLYWNSPQGISGIAINDQWYSWFCTRRISMFTSYIVMSHCRVGFIFKKHENIFALYILSQQKWHRQLKPILMQNRYPFMLHSLYHGCWWPGDARSQGISSHGIAEHICPAYYSFSTNRVDTTFWMIIWAKWNQ